jgi:putative tryptophan/tyrosine transport system substrate-binding protein
MASVPPATTPDPMSAVAATHSHVLSCEDCVCFRRGRNPHGKTPRVHRAAWRRGGLARRSARSASERAGGWLPQRLIADPIPRPLAAFRRALHEAGYIEGQNLAIEFRWAEGQNDRLPELATDLAHRHVAVIVATGGGVSALAAKAATATIPIVFSTATDPVQLGLVATLNRPGGNATGVFVLANSLEAKRLGLLHEMVRQGDDRHAGQSTGSGRGKQLAETHAAARTLARQLVVVKASSVSDLDAAFATFIQVRAGALLVAADTFFNTRREQIVALAEQYAIPAIYEFREFPLAGGLMSYGTSLAIAYHQVGVYTGKILKGENPANLPVVQPTMFEMVINLNTAKALGLTVPPALLATADEVIE